MIIYTGIIIKHYNMIIDYTTDKQESVYILLSKRRSCQVISLNFSGRVAESPSRLRILSETFGN